MSRRRPLRRKNCKKSGTEKRYFASLAWPPQPRGRRHFPKLPGKGPKCPGQMPKLLGQTPPNSGSTDLDWHVVHHSQAQRRLGRANVAEPFLASRTADFAWSLARASVNSGRSRDPERRDSNQLSVAMTMK